MTAGLLFFYPLLFLMASWAAPSPQLTDNPKDSQASNSDLDRARCTGVAYRKGGDCEPSKECSVSQAAARRNLMNANINHLSASATFFNVGGDDPRLNWSEIFSENFACWVK